MLAREVERLALREGERLALHITRERSWSDSYGLDVAQAATVLRAVEQHDARGGVMVAVQIERGGCTRLAFRAHHDGAAWRLGGGVA